MKDDQQSLTETEAHPINDHPIVGDRVIAGAGTSLHDWQQWQGLAQLPKLSLKQALEGIQRVCIFAPHPDDEVLGSGGLLQKLASLGISILLIQVTNGTQSHPQSTKYPPHILNRLRPQETLQALRVLKVEDQVKIIELNLPDGDVFAYQDELYDKLTTIVQTDDLLIAPFVHDGHPDHEVTGQVVMKYAKKHAIKCYQVLIWTWHWAKPNDKRVDWRASFKVELTDEQLARKQQAIDCFASQISVDESTGNPPILAPETINRICQLPEVYLYESST